MGNTKNLIGSLDLGSLHTQLDNLRKIYSGLLLPADDHKAAHLIAFFRELQMHPGDVVQFETERTQAIFGSPEIFVRGEIRPDVYRNLLAKLGEVDE